MVMPTTLPTSNFVLFVREPNNHINKSTTLLKTRHQNKRSYLLGLAGGTQVRCSKTNRAGHRFGVRKPTGGRDTGSAFENQRRAGHRFGVRKPTTVPTSNFVFFVRDTATGPGRPDAGFSRRLIRASALQGGIRALRKHDNGRNT